MLDLKLFLRFFYCCFFFLFISKVACQEHYTARWYTSDNNELPQSSVKKIVRDKYNFIWMTTENGLVRYDGSNFRTFNSSTIKLRGSRFFSITGNVKNDSLYCHSGAGELILINQRRVQILNKKIGSNTIIKNGKRFFYHDGLPSIQSSVADDPFCIRLTDGTKYFLSPEAIELCDAEMKSRYKMPYKSKSVFNFFTLNDNLYYLKENGEYDCFSKRKMHSGKLDPALFKTKIKLYWDTTSQQVFLYSDNRIYLLTAQGGLLSASMICEFKDFDDSNIASIFYDEENKKLYLGSRTNGLCIVSFHSFSAIKKKSTQSDVYYAAVPFKDSSVITPEGLILNPQKRLDSIVLTESGEHTPKLVMAKDDNGNIWLPKGKLFCYLKETGYKERIQYDFKQNIRTLFKGQDNTIWISLEANDSYKARLFSISGGPLHTPKLALTLNKNITYIAQYDNTTLYLGTEKGLYKYDIKTGKLFFIKNSGKITVRSIFVDSGKKIWITTYEKGFILYTNNTLYTFPKDNNGYLNTSHCIVEDQKGFLWISTNKGLFQVSRQALLHYTEDKTRKIYYHHYSKEDGFLTNEFNGGCQPCGNYLESRQIAFPSMNGMVFLKPDRIKPLLPNKEIFIDKIVMDQKIVAPKDTIVLENGFQRVNFLIDFPYYGSSNNLNIEARLSGVDNSSWEKIGTDKSISFTTLAPGEYVLTIRSLSGFDSVYNYKKMTLIVPPKFYQTLWFKIVCGVLIIGFILLLWYLRLYYIRLKNKQLKQLVIEKTKKLAKTVDKLKLAKSNLKIEVAQQERLVKSISHDIKSPLKFLSSTVRNLFDNSEIKDNSKLKRQVESIHSSSINLFEYVDNLVKYSTIFIEGKKIEDQSYSLHDLIKEKIQLFEEIALSGNTIIVNNVSKHTHIKTNNKALSIIIHNLLDNAVKHTQNGIIELECKTKDNILFLKIKDTGKGMSQEMIDYYLDFYKNPIVKNFHQGLHMIIELLIILDGTISISSDNNEGTAIEIVIEYI